MFYDSVLNPRSPNFFLRLIWLLLTLGKKSVICITEFD